MDSEDCGQEDEEDIWWYVCTLCFQAFTADTKCKAHKRLVHGSRNASNLLVLSQSADLEPRVKVSRCNSATERNIRVDYPQVSEPVVTRIRRGQGQESNLELERTPGLMKTETTSPQKQETPSPSKRPPVQQCKLCSNSFATRVQLRTHVLVSHVPDMGQQPKRHKRENKFSTAAQGSIIKEDFTLAESEAEAPDSDSGGELALPAHEIKLEETHGESQLDHEAYGAFGTQREVNGRWCPPWFRNGPKGRNLTALANGPPFVCPECYRAFSKRTPCRMHFKRAHGEHMRLQAQGKPCKCPTCYRDAFLRPSAECDWECKLCGKSVDETLISKHVVRLHPRENPKSTTSEAPSEWRAAKLAMAQTKVPGGEKPTTNMKTRVSDETAEPSADASRKLRPRTTNPSVPPTASDSELENSNSKQSEPDGNFEIGSNEGASGESDWAEEGEAVFECERYPCKYNHLRTLDARLDAMHQPALGHSSTSPAEATGTASTDAGGEPRECAEGAKSLPRQEELVSMEHFNGPPYTCSACYRTFPHRAQLRIHITSIHREHKRPRELGEACRCTICYADTFLRPSLLIEGAWDCKLCGQALEEGAARWHVQKLHPGQNTHPSTAAVPSEWRVTKERQALAGEAPIAWYGAQIHEQKKRHECSACGKSYSSRESLKEHVSAIHNTEGLKLKCPICNNVFASRVGLKTHQTVHAKSRDHLCPTCGSTFKSAGELRAHMVYHDPNGRKHVCEVRTKAFFTNTAMHLHRRSHNAREITCPECGKLFKQNKDLRFHREMEHLGVRPFKCDKCEATFKTKNQLQRHDGVHVEGTPHACPQCPKAFKTEYHLKDHVSVCHEGKGKPKVHICRVCKQGFPGRQTLLRHELEEHDFQRGSKRYECKHCNAKFAVHWNFKQHEAGHKNERSLRCDHPGCDKTFNLGTHLKQHRVTHLSYDELPNVCDCGKRFGLVSQLRYHKKRIHEKEQRKSRDAVVRVD